MSTPRARRPGIPTLAALLWLADPGLLATAAAPVQPVREELLVREVEVLVEAPKEAAVARRALAAGGLEVEEDGAPRAVANVAMLPRTERWQVVVFLDQVLAAPELVAAGALAAAAAAEDLTALGRVEVVTADPAPRVLAATGDSEALAAVLAAAAAAALGDLRARPPAQSRPAPELTAERAAIARRQCDRLLAWLANRGSGVPRLLVLVTDGVTLSPAAQNLAGGSAASAAAGEPGPAERIWVEATAEAARSLGALGWTVAVLAPRGEALRLSALAERDSDRYQRERREELQRGAPNRGIDLLALFQLLSGRKDFSPGLAVGDAVDLRRPALRPWAVETGGALLGRDGELAILLERLRRRWLLAYQSPSPRDGREHRVRVRAAADGRELGGQRWTGSVLESITAARLRLLLAGELPADDGGLAVAARRDGGEVVIEVKGLAAPEAAHADLRIAVAFVTADGRYQVAIRAPTADPAAGALAPWRLVVPATATGVAVTLENVRLGTWAGALTPIAVAPALR